VVLLIAIEVSEFEEPRLAAWLFCGATCLEIRGLGDHLYTLLLAAAARWSNDETICCNKKENAQGLNQQRPAARGG
jgi:hypothetical protein